MPIESKKARTQSPVERVATVESSDTASRFDALSNEVSELKLLLKVQVTPESRMDDLNAVSSKQSSPSLPPRKCFSCGSTTNLQRQCSSAPPVRGKGRNQGRFYRCFLQPGRKKSGLYQLSEL